MSKILIPNFEARQPKLSEYLLGNNQAQTALNCDLQSGKLQPLKALGSISTQTSVTPKSIFKLGSNWVDFGDDVYADVVRDAFTQIDDNIVWTDGVYPKKTTATLGIAGAKRLGIIPPTTGTPLTSTLADIAAISEVEIGAIVSYVYTYVSADGEESAPSDASVVLNVPLNKYVVLSGFINPETAGNAAGIVTKVRIYRIASGTTNAEYQFLAEVDSFLLIIAGSFDDYVIDTGLIEVGLDTLATEGWDPPVDGLQGLLEYANGILAGFYLNTLYVSEIFIPYAFPSAYSIDVDSNIVAIAAYRETIFILTAEKAYVVAGVNPEALMLAPLPNSRGCVSKRSVVVTPDGVMYASADGIELVTETSSVLFTDNIFTKAQWQALSISNLISFYYNGYYHAFFSGTTTGFIITKTGIIDLSLADHTIYGGNVNPTDKKLYLLVETSSVYYIKSFEGSTSSYLTYTFKTKKFITPTPTGFASGRLLKATGSISLIYYVDDVLVSSQTIFNEQMFRLPAVVGNKHEIELHGSTDVYLVIVASTPEELNIG